MHSKPKLPTPEKRSKIFELYNLNFIKLECSKILKIDSFTASLSGLVSLSFGVNNFLPL